MATLTRGQQIDKYTVQSLIKENLYTETYRVEDEDGNPFFMKVFVIKRVPEKLLNKETGTVLEIEFCRQMKHRNLVSYTGSGTLDCDEGTCQYYLTNYFSGELLTEKLQREGKLGEEEATGIYRGMLEGLKYMHREGLFHNDITPRNIMLTADGPEIIDLGHTSRKCAGKVPFDVSDLEELYSANETFSGIYDEQSDIFAATAVLYAMLTGEAPWKTEFTDAMKRARRAMLLSEKRKTEPIDYGLLNVSDKTKAILAKGLAVAYADRYKSIEQILADLDTTEKVEAPTPRKDDGLKTDEPDSAKDGNRRETENPNRVDFEIKRGGGNGFRDIAGMLELKNYLSQNVIFVIKNKEKAEKYKLKTPNGMLLYGPPGCGKTFVAEKFAEETGFNYLLVKSSDLASSYVHGAQEKIAQLFQQAEKNAPIVVCFDEFDALVPDRSTPAAQYTSGEVNEFLSQLNNCAKRGIFVVGTTNRPDKIDPAVLRTGRIDKQVYVPLPDREARREMFMIHLDGRPYAAVDTDKLSEMTEGYIASDIAYVVEDAARVAAYTDQDITEELLETSVRNTRPSLRADTLKIYDDIKMTMENTERRNMGRPRIGYV